MNLVRHVVGPLAENVYILSPEGSRECVVIDPGAEGTRLVDDIRLNDLEVRYMVVTHGHGDHTGAVAMLKEELGVTFAAHAGDRAQIDAPPAWCAEVLPDFQDPPPVDLFLEHGDRLEFGGAELEVIATPGHTPGSVCYLFGGVVFTGDTLFAGSIGRYDLPGGDGERELQSIRERLLTLPPETLVRPGHGAYTTIGDERESNPFLRGGFDPRS